MDLLALPYLNKGIYQLCDLPAGYQSEINRVIEAAYRRDIIGQLEQKMAGKPRGMMFFKWYGKNLENSVEMPEYHEPYRFIRTIGVSVFNKKQSTGKHYGPLAIDAARALQRKHDRRPQRVHPSGRACPLLARREAIHLRRHAAAPIVQRIGQGALLHVRRYSAAELAARVMSGILACIRVLISRFRAVFYKHWTFLK